MNIPRVLTFRDSLDSLNLSTVEVDVSGAEDEEQKNAFRSAIEAVEDPDKDISEMNEEVRRKPAPQRSDTDDEKLDGIRRKMSLMIKENAKEKRNSTSNQPPIERQQVDLEEAKQSEREDPKEYVSSDEEGDKQFDLEQDRLDQKKKCWILVYYITFTCVHVFMIVVASCLGFLDKPILTSLSLGFNILVLVYCIVVKVFFNLKGIEYSLLAIQVFVIIRFFREPDILDNKRAEKELFEYISMIMIFHSNFIIIRMVFPKQQLWIWIASIFLLLISIPYRIIGPKNFIEHIPLLVSMLLSFSLLVFVQFFFLVKFDKI
jgi:hypothetical protein